MTSVEWFGCLDGIDVGKLSMAKSGLQGVDKLDQKINCSRENTKRTNPCMLFNLFFVFFVVDDQILHVIVWCMFLSIWSMTRLKKGSKGHHGRRNGAE